ncbi:type I-E CRISPR-associated protein Cse2/CasB [Mariniluteicoccus flavus]
MSESNKCGAVVRGRIATLAGDPAHLSPYARAALANLRRGVGKAPGSVPQIWDLTMVDDRASGPPSWRETAVHVALTQWAAHQQAKAAPMHREDRRFGEALRLLAASQKRTAPQGTPAYRRMMALASSRNLAGITTHARGLIAQLRVAGLGFDYGRWADNLYWLQVPGRAVHVQREWGRDFYRLTEDKITELLGDDNTQPTDATQGELR